MFKGIKRKITIKKNNTTGKYTATTGEYMADDFFVEDLTNVNFTQELADDLDWLAIPLSVPESPPPLTLTIDLKEQDEQEEEESMLFPATQNDKKRKRSPSDSESGRALKRLQTPEFPIKRCVSFEFNVYEEKKFGEEKKHLVPKESPFLYSFFSCGIFDIDTIFDSIELTRIVCDQGNFASYLCDRMPDKKNSSIGGLPVAWHAQDTKKYSFAKYNTNLEIKEVLYNNQLGQPFNVYKRTFVAEIQLKNESTFDLDIYTLSTMGYDRGQINIQHDGFLDERFLDLDAFDENIKIKPEYSKSKLLMYFKAVPTEALQKEYDDPESRTYRQYNAPYMCLQLHPQRVTLFIDFAEYLHAVMHQTNKVETKFIVTPPECVPTLNDYSSTSNCFGFEWMIVEPLDSEVHCSSFQEVGLHKPKKIVKIQNKSRCKSKAFEDNRYNFNLIIY